MDSPPRPPLPRRSSTADNPDRSGFTTAASFLSHRLSHLANETRPPSSMPSHSINPPTSPGSRRHSRRHSLSVALAASTSDLPPSLSASFASSNPNSPAFGSSYTTGGRSVAGASFAQGERRPLLPRPATLAVDGDSALWGIRKRPSRIWQQASKVTGWVNSRRHSGAHTPKWEDGGQAVPAAHKGGYDAEFAEELAGDAGNGMRVWYDTMTSVDWLHDIVKESFRLKKLREMRGARGWVANAWDKLQGWLLVTSIGIVTAFFAWGIVSLEMWLFDIKEGYCSTNWRAAKRFCCVEPSTRPALFDFSTFTFLPFTNLTVGPTGRAFSPTSFLSQWAPSGIHAFDKEEDACPDWRTWSEAFNGVSGTEPGNEEKDNWMVDWAMLVMFALMFAGVSSVMTVYLTSSERVSSSKDRFDGRVVDDDGFMESPGKSEAGDETPNGRYGTNGETEAMEASGSSQATVEPPQVRQVPRPRKVMYFAAGSGIPEIKVILSGFVIRGYLGSWVLATKSIGLALSVASGLSLGKEGPFVHIASCIGNIFTRLLRKYDLNEAKRREVLSAGCAAGVAVAFGAPLGGVLFAMEEVSYFFPPRVLWRSFWCAMVASAVLRWLNPFGTGKTVLFEVTYDQQWHFVELAGFVVLGVIGGVIGAWFAQANVWWSKHVRNGTWVKRHPVIEVLGVTLLTAIIGFFNPYLKKGGTEVVYEMLSECQPGEDTGLCVARPSQAGPLLLTILAAAICKYLITIITFGIKVPAGIFVPSLAVGACIGRAAGLTVEWFYHHYPDAGIFEACSGNGVSNPGFGQACILPGVWAMVGAAGVLAGVTRTTVSLAVIVMELTGSLVYVIPIMLSVLVAKTTADAIESRSIYDLSIEAADLPYLDAKTEYIHQASPCDIMDTDAAVIDLTEQNTVAQLRVMVDDLYASGAAGGFPIVNREADGPRVYGYIGSRELLVALHGLVGSGHDNAICTFTSSSPASLSASMVSTYDFGHLVDHAPVTVSVRSPMELLHEMFVRLGVRYLVIQDERGLYRGLVEKNRYLRYLSWAEERQKHVSHYSDSGSDTGSSSA